MHIDIITFFFMIVVNISFCFHSFGHNILYIFTFNQSNLAIHAMRAIFWHFNTLYHLNICWEWWWWWWCWCMIRMNFNKTLLTLSTIWKRQWRVGITRTIHTTHDTFIIVITRIMRIRNRCCPTSIVIVVIDGTTTCFLMILISIRIICGRGWCRLVHITLAHSLSLTLHSPPRLIGAFLLTRSSNSCFQS